MKLLRHFLFVMLLAPFGAYAATVDVWFSPQDTGPILEGNTFSVDIMVGNYAGTGTGVLGGAVDLAFDPSILQAQGVTLASPMTYPGLNIMGLNPGVTSNLNGTIETIGLATLGVFPEPIVLATVQFLALSIGTSNLVLSDAADMALAWADDIPVAVTPSFTNGSVSVVPLPAAAWLMLSGLGACGFLARRKTKAEA